MSSEVEARSTGREPIRRPCRGFTSAIIGSRLSPKVHTLEVHPRDELLRGVEPLGDGCHSRF